MRARISRGRGRLFATIVFAGLALWAVRHIFHIIDAGSISTYLYETWVYLFSFAVVVIALLLAYRERPRGYHVDDTTREHVTVVVPAYNEDPAALKACLASIVDQTRKVNDIYVIDDGSTTGDYAEVRNWFFAYATQKMVTPYWYRQENAGKRHAQAVAFTRAHTSSIFVTVDSDSILDPEAIKELMKPFVDPSIQSVAGVVLAKNNRTNLLARVTDLLFVTGQLVDRSMMSRLSSVLVNSGGLAAYRAAVVRDNLDAYLHETFFGRRIEFSDDSMLTLYALERGKTVQQPSAFVFTMMPDKLSHHLRQQVRWMKGSFIRSWWRLRYLPLLSFGFVRQAVGWLQFVMTTSFLALLIFSGVVLHPELMMFVLLAPIFIGYMQALRYFSVRRSDETFASQLLTFSLAPLAIIWSYAVLRPIRLYASLTCFKAGWGTRQKVEVMLEAPPVRAFSVPIYAVQIEGRYARLTKALHASGVSQERAQEVWNAYYQSLSSRQRKVLWRSYERQQARQRRYATSPHHRRITISSWIQPKDMHLLRSLTQELAPANVALAS